MVLYQISGKIQVIYDFVKETQLTASSTYLQLAAPGRRRLRFLAVLQKLNVVDNVVHEGHEVVTMASHEVGGCLPELLYARTVRTQLVCDSHVHAGQKFGIKSYFHA